MEAELPEAEHHLEDIAKADEEKAEAETGEADAEAAVAKKLKTLGHPAEGVTLSTKPAETGEFV